MTRKTIRRRLRLSLFDSGALDWIFGEMKGIPDKQTETGGKDNARWSEVLGRAFEKFPRADTF